MAAAQRCRAWAPVIAAKGVSPNARRSCSEAWGKKKVRRSKQGSLLEPAAAGDHPELTRRLEALIEPPGFTGRVPGRPSRWSTERSAEWKPLKPTLVVEVRYDDFSQGRFRHGTKVLRWRPDKLPRQCTMDQAERRVSTSPPGLPR